MCNLCVFVRRREKFLHKQEINSKRGRKVCAKGATMSQTLWSVLVHSTRIYTRSHTCTLWQLQFTFMLLGRDMVVITKTPIILSVVITVTVLWPKMWKFSIVIVFAFQIFRCDEWSKHFELCNCSFRINRFRITFALEKLKYTRLQMDFWIIESQRIE